MPINKYLPDDSEIRKWFINVPGFKLAAGVFEPLVLGETVSAGAYSGLSHRGIGLSGESTARRACPHGEFRLGLVEATLRSKQPILPRRKFRYRGRNKSALRPRAL
jgi:hypothetical protein